LNLTYTLASQAASAIENASLYEELQKSETEYRSLYENAVEGIFRCTADTRIVSVNPSLPGILGYSSPQDLLDSITDIAAISFVEKDRFIELWTILNQDQRIANFETRLFRKDQTIIWVSINAAVIRDESGKTRYIDGSIIDITERIKREKAEREKEIIQHQSNEYKQLLHVLCHDLANPLANLKGFLSMLNEDLSIYEKVGKYMMLSADNGLSIIDYVRKLSAIEENKVTLALERHNLKSLVDESGYILYQQFKNKGIRLNNRADTSHFVQVDKTSFINSVVNNLLSNAIKFSFPGASIDVDSAMDKGMIVLTVTDHGIGMPPGILESVFDLSKKTSREGTGGEIGVGFGMPLVKTFITAYGGTISLSSTEKIDPSNDHGTRIRIELKPA
jgi:PAS domain S-box-containing protein